MAANLSARWRQHPKPDPAVLEAIDQLRAAAVSGQIRSLAAVVINPMLEVETIHVGADDNVRQHLLLGGLVALKHKILPET